ncbi:hypothetical protein TCAL_10989 [Tigriopus californicus]|uniref:DNA polymerase eta n=1 Tax=Tigriopus californicus TaxID=6832 RepID=A0A553NB38_TIGCA|nr:DNA polymerase eta-like [Tigriopus californicus]TRY62599.1 hypothetical protein TCAL_10989 [Tigriopus californicus]|eukprot:TCALIF_10989-PA protein Name:"Similar to POLH DNA polymerase eta (Homo sapiens)" AED:0.09 eAED:0.09 QI:0/-1/0/1/-1/1/1/0/574
MTERVVVLIDMDCFYCQVETRANAALAGQPLAVVQYNSWKGGGIIAVNYEARAQGVTRNMRGDEARTKCPEIVLVSVPEVRQKADLTKYRDAGKEVIQVLLQFGAVVERASIDEAYLDITALVDEKLKTLTRVEATDLPHTFVVGCEDDRETGLSRWLAESYETSHSDNIRLAVGGMIVEAMRQAVWEQTQFRCSAGVAHNKMLSKLSCGLHKPNQQTVLPHDKIDILFAHLKLTKLRGLGGKLGDSIREQLGCETVADLAKHSISELKGSFEEKTAQWLYNISRGLEYEPVKERDLPKSIGCSKNFLGPKMLDTREKVEFWFGSLAEEVCERLERDREANGRIARGITVSMTIEGKGHVSRAGPLNSYDAEKMTRQAMNLVGKLNESTQDPYMWRPKLKNLSISASKFEDDSISGTVKSIDNFFTKASEASADEPTSSLAANDKLKATELVPDLDQYDPSILTLLPPRLRAAIEKRVQSLKVEDLSREKEKAMEACSKCDKLISPFDMPEHLDYHVALDLQTEMRKEQPKAQIHTVHLNTAKSKKKKSNEPLEKPDTKRQKNILSFFQKPGSN